MLPPPHPPETYSKTSTKSTHTPWNKTRIANPLFFWRRKIEKWLNSLLCLDATILPKSPALKVPPSFYMWTLLRQPWHPLQLPPCIWSVPPTYDGGCMLLPTIKINEWLAVLSDAPAHHLFVTVASNKDWWKSFARAACSLTSCVGGRGLVGRVIMDGLGGG